MIGCFAPPIDDDRAWSPIIDDRIRFLAGGHMADDRQRLQIENRDVVGLSVANKAAVELDAIAMPCTPRYPVSCRRWFLYPRRAHPPGAVRDVQPPLAWSTVR